MSGTWRHLPAPARAIAVASCNAVAAAVDRDPEAFEAATERLAALDPQLVGRVLGGTVRLLLERLHPDGLDGDDIRAALQRCVRSAADWRAAVDPHVVLVLLAGALGVYDAEADDQPPDVRALAVHGPLLVADLLARQSQPFADHLTRALGEIERAELQD